MPTARPSEAADAARSVALDRLRRVLRGVDRRVAARGEVCLGGGACCRFDLMGHRLYVSALELALLEGCGVAPRCDVPPLRCPWQRGPRCVARDARPLGCRTFFCRPRPAETSLEDLYERCHRLIRRIHERAGIPYVYMEMTSAASPQRVAQET